MLNTDRISYRARTRTREPRSQETPSLYEVAARVREHRIVGNWARLWNKVQSIYRLRNIYNAIDDQLAEVQNLRWCSSRETCDTIPDYPIPSAPPADVANQNANLIETVYAVERWRQWGEAATFWANILLAAIRLVWSHLNIVGYAGSAAFVIQYLGLYEIDENEEIIALIAEAPAEAPGEPE
jgi:hypothetical protein